MTVTAQTPYNASTAAPGATVFPYSFKIVSATDMRVLVDGVVKSYPADYAVSGVGIDAGGDVTFVVPMVGGEQVLVKADMAYERTTDYQHLGDLRSPTLNNDQDAPVLMIRQIDARFDRTLQVPEALLGRFNVTLPAVITPLSALVINAAGDAVEMGSTTLTGDMLLRPNIAAGTDALFRQNNVNAVTRGLVIKQRETLSATDFAGVDPTGVGDSTAGINAALQYAKSVGKRCHLPSGVYKISGTILVPGGAELVGEGWQPYTAYGTVGTLGKGTVIHVTHTGSPAILVQKDGSNRTSGASIRNLAMYWDHAAPGPGWVPTVYDWAIKVNSADDVLIEDVLLVNPYKGITLTATLGPSGRLNLNRVYGQPLLTGIEIVYSVDVTSMHRVHFWPFWSDDSNVRAWMKANASCFLRSLRNDNCQVSHLFGFGYANGIQIIGDGTGTTLRLEGVNIDFDDCVRGFHVASSAGNSSGTFVNFGMTANPATTNADLFVIESGLCDYDFVNLTLGNSQQSGMRVTGNASKVRVVNLWINQWNIQAAANPAIYVGADARVDVTQGKYFTGNGGPVLQEVGNGIGAIGEWMAYAPTIATGAGTLTSATATGRKRRVGNTVNLEVDVVITTNGTGATSVLVGLPYTAAANSIFYGRERNAIGFGVSAQVLAAGGLMTLTKAVDNAYPGANAHTLTVSGTYEV